MTDPAHYPVRLDFDFVVGLNRRALRVVAYAALMTDRCPPFRLDSGGPAPGSGPAPPPAGCRGRRARGSVQRARGCSDPVLPWSAGRVRSSRW
ncbi:hypothetical protein HDA36_001229 [Nocardiopsis composta]|uniref:Uncharacterized protein n=1 Tax=Nocardiopsis composta TaxID=157465 RepID=A0A7W8QJX5_9ACTN|nr:hypothetical protein [Nocardiopsis composta]